MLDSAKQESLEWRRKYEETWNKKKAVKDQVEQGVQEKMDKYELESSALKLQLKDLNDKYESVQTAVHALEMGAQILVQDRIQMEQKYPMELKRFV
ncbi:guanylate-binding protein [Salix suchowensis]|nr:guanylate-binding protein [Salix suchowensis]